MLKTTVFMQAFPNQTYDLEIEKGKSIRVSCFYKNISQPREFDKTFLIGDWAEYDSYNLKYIGKIVSITEKTVTIQHRYENTRTRLTLAQFAWRNFNFDFEKVTAENHEESLHI